MKNEVIVKETEKAIQVKAVVSATYAPMGGFVSSMVQDREFSTLVWFPKSQLDEEGYPKAWIMDAKAKDAAEFRCPTNCRVLHASLYIVLL